MYLLYRFLSLHPSPLHKRQGSESGHQEGQGGARCRRRGSTEKYQDVYLVCRRGDALQHFGGLGRVHDWVAQPARVVDLVEHLRGGRVRGVTGSRGVRGGLSCI